MRENKDFPRALLGNVLPGKAIFKIKTDKDSE
jgi:hypothetical protein